MRCPFASVLASPVPAALALGILVVVPVVTAGAEPRVAASRQANTTESPPRAPIVRVRPAPAGSAVLDVVGDGDWCAGMWTLAARDRELTFGLSRDRSRQPDGTCALRLTVTGLSPGRWTLHIGTARVVALVR